MFSDIFLEWLGYVASLIILISLLMSSIKKLRWINLIGAILFSIYGFSISSLPTGFMNFGIAIIDIYYLVKMYRSKDFFSILRLSGNNEFITTFLSHYKNDIKKFQTVKEISLSGADIVFFTMRNMTPAGIFIARQYDVDTLEIILDYVIPPYRDFKIGTYVFEQERDVFLDDGYKQFIIHSTNKEHVSYIKRMGFEPVNGDESNIYKKTI